MATNTGGGGSWGGKDQKAAGKQAKAQAEAAAKAVAAQQKAAAEAVVTPGPAMANGPFAAANIEDAAKFIDILNQLGVPQDAKTDLIKQYQMQALFAGGDEDILSSLSTSMQPAVQQAMEQGAMRESLLAQQLAAQSLILPFAQQSAARARESGQFGAGLLQSYASFLPPELQGMVTTMAERRRNASDQLAEAYAQQAYSLPAMQAMAMNKQLAAQQAESTSGGDFAAALAGALGKGGGK
jgi:hypothetical protein